MKAEKKEINIQIGKRLQTARENSGYTQEVFAETLDVGVEHYRKIESGVYGLQPEKMLILYEKYRIEPTYLVTGDTNHKVDIELFLANCSNEESIYNLYSNMKRNRSLLFEESIGVPKEVVLEWIHKIDPFYSAYGKDYYRIVVEYLEMIKIN